MNKKSKKKKKKHVQKENEKQYLQTLKKIIAKHDRPNFSFPSLSSPFIPHPAHLQLLDSVVVCLDGVEPRELRERRRQCGEHIPGDVQHRQRTHCTQRRKCAADGDVTSADREDGWMTFETNKQASKQTSKKKVVVGFSDGDEHN